MLITDLKVGRLCGAGAIFFLHLTSVLMEWLGDRNLQLYDAGGMLYDMLNQQPSKTLKFYENRIPHIVLNFKCF
jgi:hypothetical protein